jgi:hypothetical protein
MPPADRVKQLTPYLMLVACLAAVIAAIGLWRVGAEAGERTCIERALAKYPGVPVSASLPKDESGSGPLQLSYDKARRAAVDKCD